MDLLKFLKKYTLKSKYQAPAPVHAPVRPVRYAKTLLFQITDRVEWDSQAGGTVSIKTGYVVDVLEAGQKPFTNHGAYQQAKAFYRIMFNYGPARKTTSYVVATEQGPRGGKPRLYWPKSENLRKVTK